MAFWYKLARHYRDNDSVIFGILNEPNTMSTESDANASVQAKRDTGATNLIWYYGMHGEARQAGGRNGMARPMSLQCFASKFLAIPMLMKSIDIWIAMDRAAMLPV
jgi:hypothetical protein